MDTLRRAEYNNASRRGNRTNERGDWMRDNERRCDGSAGEFIEREKKLLPANRDALWNGRRVFPWCTKCLLYTWVKLKNQIRGNSGDCFTIFINADWKCFHRRILSEQLNLTLSVCIAAVYILHSPPSLLPSLYVIALARIAMTGL